MRPSGLHSADGVELIKSLNYVLARGGNPSPWRTEPVDAIAGPAHIETLTETQPDWVKKLVARYANQITATIALAPAGVVFGYRQIEAMVAGTLFEPLGYDFERRGADLQEPHAAQRRDRDGHRCVAVLQSHPGAQEEERSVGARGSPC